MKKTRCVAIICLSILLSFSSLLGEESGYLNLVEQFSIHHRRESDINEHLPTLRRFAAECSSIVELGVRNVVSTWGLLLGLAESPHGEKIYTGVDIAWPEQTVHQLAEKLSRENGISFRFWHENDMNIDIDETDLLMIDTLHTYVHLTYELEKFSPKIRKYIIMHDTSDITEYRDCPSYQGDHSEYPLNIRRTKKGLWPAVIDFLEQHPEWSICQRYTNNYGLTILKRNGSSQTSL
jgi:hypothetical protein